MAFDDFSNLPWTQPVTASYTGRIVGSNITPENGLGEEVYMIIGGGSARPNERLPV